MKAELDELHLEVVRLRAELDAARAQLAEEKARTRPGRAADPELARRLRDSLHERFTAGEGRVPLPELRRAADGSKEAFDLALLTLEREGAVLLLPIRNRHLVAQESGIDVPERGLLYFACPV